MVKNIKVYTTNTCAYCKTIKKYLSSKNIAYCEINLSEHPEEQAEALRVSGVLSVPITLITKTDGMQEVVVGLNLSRLSAIIE